MISILRATEKDIGSIVNIGNISVPEAHKGSCADEIMNEFLSKNYIYKELAGIITFLIERRRLPALPKRLHSALRFSFAEA